MVADEQASSLELGWSDERRPLTLRPPEEEGRLAVLMPIVYDKG